LKFSNQDMKQLIRQLRFPGIINLTVHYQHCVKRFSSFDNRITNRILFHHRYATLFHHKTLGFNPLFNIRVCRFAGGNQDVVVPNLGDSVPEGTIRSIHKKEGDEVHTDEVVLEIETDKVSVDVRAPKDGVITKLHKKAQDDVQVGDLLFSLAAGNVSPKSTTATTASKPPPATPTASNNNNVKEPKQAQQAHESKQVHESSTSNHRTPMIQFRYGKRTTEAPKDKPTSTGASTNASRSTVDTHELPSKFQPRIWTELDVEVINSGGADLWDLKQLRKPKAKKKQAA